MGATSVLKWNTNTNHSLLGDDEIFTDSCGVGVGDGKQFYPGGGQVSVEPMLATQMGDIHQVSVRKFRFLPVAEKASNPFRL